MRNKTIELKYYNTYYIANIVNNVLRNPMPFYVNLNGFWGEDAPLEFSKPFQKYSVFHLFIEYVVSNILYEANTDSSIIEYLKDDKYDSFCCVHENYNKLPIERALSYHGVKHESFQSFLQALNKSIELADEDDLYEYMNELLMTGTLEELYEIITNEVFYIMFTNRAILQLFNTFIADSINGFSDIIPLNFQLYFRKDGILKRKRIPKWAKKAIFYRDKGRYVFCNKDVSGSLCIQNEHNFDHIVPLSQGGINDVTNLQLLCKECNSAKSNCNSATSSEYHAWY